MYAFDSRIRYSETDSEGRLTLNALLNYFRIVPPSIRKMWGLESAI